MPHVLSCVGPERIQCQNSCVFVQSGMEGEGVCLVDDVKVDSAQKVGGCSSMVFWPGEESYGGREAAGGERRLLSPTDMGVLHVVAGRMGRTSTDRQSARAVEVLGRLQMEGCSGELVPDP